MIQLKRTRYISLDVCAYGSDDRIRTGTNDVIFPRFLART